MKREKGKPHKRSTELHEFTYQQLAQAKVFLKQRSGLSSGIMHPGVAVPRAPAATKFSACGGAYYFLPVKIYRCVVMTLEHVFRRQA